MGSNMFLSKSLLEKISRLIVCIVFAMLYTLSMIYAVLIGATGGQVPSDSAWFRNIVPIHLIYLTEALFITFLPMLMAVNLNTILLKYVMKENGHTFRGNLVRLIIGVFLALPLLYIAVTLFISSGFILSWPEVVIAQSGVAALFLVLYPFCTTIVFSEEPRQYLRDCVSNPMIWVVAIIFTGILLFPLAMLVTPLQKGYFRYFPTHEQFLLNLPDLIMRASLIGVLLSVVQYGLLYFGRKSGHQVKTVISHEAIDAVR